MANIRRNFESDFDFILNIEGLVGFPNFDFWGKILGGGRTYQFSCIGGEMRNVFNDNGKIHVVCNAHKMCCGDLYLIFYVNPDNAIYPDGKQLTATPIPLGITLVHGKGDEATEIEVETTIPVVYITAYELAVRSGYTGTKEQWEAANASLPKATEAARHQPIIGENDNWWLWDFERGEYVDSGKPSSGGGVEVVQTTGQSTTAVMSQKAVTDSLNGIVDACTEAIGQEAQMRAAADALLQPKQDTSLETESDTIVGAINEVRSALVQEGQSRANADEQIMQDLDTKVEKVAAQSGNPFVYGRMNSEAGGAEGKFTMDAKSASANTVVQRNGNGQICTAQPTANNHATPKKYVDDEVDAAAATVTQERTTIASQLAVLLKPNNTTATVTNKTYFIEGVTVKPSDGTLNAPKLSEGNTLIANKYAPRRSVVNINEQSYTIATLASNTDYVFGAAVSLLTINQVVVSTSETRLFLTTSTSIPVINIPSSVKKIGEVLFEASTQYIVTFLYGTVKVEKAV